MNTPQNIRYATAIEVTPGEFGMTGGPFPTLDECLQESGKPGDVVVRLCPGTPDEVVARWESAPWGGGDDWLLTMAGAYYDSTDRRPRPITCQKDCPECGGEGEVNTETGARHGDPGHKCDRCDGKGQVKTASITFHVCFNGDMSAGLHPYDDEVTVACHSGDWGGEDGEFLEHIRSSLAEWYDGATVEVASIDENG